MATATRTVFVDESGQPLSDRIQQVLRALTPKLRRRFPTLRDEVVVTEILEEAGRRILERERHIGPIERLHGYAWVSIRHLATSHLRLSSTRLQQQTVSGTHGMAAIASLPATTASADRIERHILFAEVLAVLSEEEQKVCVWKNMGFSSREIARHRGNSTEAIDTMFFRAKRKVRQALGLGTDARGTAAQSQTTRNERRDTGGFTPADVGDVDA